MAVCRWVERLVHTQVKRFLAALIGKELFARELRTLPELSDALSFRQLFLRRAIDVDMVEVAVPENPVAEIRGIGSPGNSWRSTRR